MTSTQNMTYLSVQGRSLIRHEQFGSEDWRSTVELQQLTLSHGDSPIFDDHAVQRKFTVFIMKYNQGLKAFLWKCKVSKGKPTIKCKSVIFQLTIHSLCLKVALGHLLL